ncbi:MAG: threonine synthase, partial [Clostridia bacterium]|nr:threonine synthase [Clostridia bacterium]
EVIAMGLAPDGGLFMPTSIPAIGDEEWEHLRTLSYPALAADILHRYLDDYSEQELLEDANAAYGPQKFPEGAPAVNEVSDKLYSMELWHGPTCAFKDMALQMMPRLLSRALKKTNESKTALILVATSGDTGKAALEGFKDVDGVKIMVFYPAEGVSDTQKLQMITQEGQNVSVCGICGNFDDAQNGVKTIFADEIFEKALAGANVFLSSANSINWGRLVPQIVYYVRGYLTLVNQGKIKMGETVDVCVPTGNFGNILAAYFAKKMGVPFGKFICASNHNNVLTDFFASGTYNRNRPFFQTISPSMDILISSNLERLLYLVCGAQKTALYMKELKENGAYTLGADEFEAIAGAFVGYFASDEATKETLRKVYEENGYLADTHTSVALDAAISYQKTAESQNAILVASTASPFKFSEDVLSALKGDGAQTKNAAKELAASTGAQIPQQLANLAQKAVRFSSVIEKNAMQDAVWQFATSKN